MPLRYRRPPTRRLLATLLCSAFVGGVPMVGSGSAHALGLGSPGSAAVLGQPLDFPLAVRLEAGEALAPECVDAEVAIGDRRLAAGAVRASLVQSGATGATVRVQTNVRVDEPVVEVQVTVGCTARVSRRYVLFADPPALSGAPVLAAADAPPPAAEAAPAAAAAALPGSTGPATGSAAEQRPARATSTRPRREAASSPSGRTAAAAPTARAPARQRRAEAPAPAPRLRVDVIEPAARPAATAAATAAVVEEAFAAVEAAASAARAAASAASAAQQRIASLEQTVARLQSEAGARRDETEQLRQRLAEAERSGRWTTPLAVGGLVLLLLAGWLAWRLRALERERRLAWHEAAGQPLPAAVPVVTSELQAPAAGPAPQARPAWPPMAAAAAEPPADTLPPAPVPAAALRRPAPASGPAPALSVVDLPLDEPPAVNATLSPASFVTESARDVSIEELLDLEQQAEFFIALGQDDAAIDLLAEHVRGTGGGSPLPYLKLLEIYRRCDDREAYDRTRRRFNDRFNAYAPDWDSDLQAGHALEDYPGVLPRLQQLWSRPLDAMAELEALLFRRSRGQLFDLPAYRDVLLLYAIARDLHERESSSGENVDLLLPIAEAGVFETTSPAPFLQTDADPRRPDDAAPTAPIDLDLTEPSQPGTFYTDAIRRPRER